MISLTFIKDLGTWYKVLNLIESSIIWAASLSEIIYYYTSSNSFNHSHPQSRQLLRSSQKCDFQYSELPRTSSSVGNDAVYVLKQFYC